MDDNKKSTTIWLRPSVISRMDGWLEADNCQSRSEFVDKALRFYMGYLGTEGLTPNSFSHRIRKSVDALGRSGITVSFRKSNGDRLICLKRVDGVDDPAAENIVTIDPESPPCFGV